MGEVYPVPNPGVARGREGHCKLPSFPPHQPQVAAAVFILGIRLCYLVSGGCAHNLAPLNHPAWGSPLLPPVGIHGHSFSHGPSRVCTQPSPACSQRSPVSRHAPGPAQFQATWASAARACCASGSVGAWNSRSLCKGMGRARRPGTELPGQSPQGKIHERALAPPGGSPAWKIA